MEYFGKLTDSDIQLITESSVNEMVKEKIITKFLEPESIIAPSLENKFKETVILQH